MKRRAWSTCLEWGRNGRYKDEKESRGKRAIVRAKDRRTESKEEEREKIYRRSMTDAK
jgi:hypothetical protein